LVCCGATTGEVTLRDPRTFKVEHRVQAHTGTISDIDTTGNLLLTCGFSSRCVARFMQRCGQEPFHAVNSNMRYTAQTVLFRD
jgi:hypothetical protein